MDRESRMRPPVPPGTAVRFRRRRYRDDGSAEFVREGTGIFVRELVASWGVHLWIVTTMHPRWGACEVSVVPEWGDSMEAL